MMSLYSFASSASHKVLASSFNCIFATSTWLSSGIWDAFKRSVVSIRHCSTSRGFSALVKTTGCNYLKSKTLPDLCSLGATNKPWRGSSIYFCWFSIILWRTLINILFSRIVPRSAWTITVPLSFHTRVGKKTTKNWKVERWRYLGIKERTIRKE